MAEIEERVVEMRFDNKQFQDGTKESMKAIDELEKKLKMDEAGKGLSILGAATETVSVKFNAMSVVAITALQRMTNSAINTGERMVKSLSTDQIAAGWDKYADKTAAVQTIMAATAKNFTDTGEQMAYVNEQLDKLNWFTDETSYNFLDMVSNIGKFTSNNIDLKTSVTAMQGIANWAAISGANANEASRAMYNLSQAIAVGSVKLIDWKSIENANMATAQFKETAIETAASLGTLTKVGDGLYKTIKGNEVSVSNFNEALSDAWFTSDVLLKTLGQYGGLADELYNSLEGLDITTSRMLQFVDQYKAGTLDISSAAEEAGITTDELTEKLQKLADSGFDLGLKAFRAAQEAKTFGEAISSVKDAVSTGWMNTFEIIFGNYQEAKVLWTDLANALYDIFAEGGNARNEMLAAWKELGGRTDLLNGVIESFRALSSMVAPLKEGFRDIFPRTTAEQLYAITKSFAEFTNGLRLSEERADQYRRTFRGLLALIDTVRIVAGQVLGVVLGPLFSAIGVGADGFFALTANIGDAIYALRNFVKEVNVVEKAAYLLGVGLEKLADFFDMLANIPIVQQALAAFVSNIRKIYSVLQPFFAGLSISVLDFIARLKAMDHFDFGGILSAVAQLVKDISANFGLIEFDFSGLISALKKGTVWIREELVDLAAFVKKVINAFGFDNPIVLAYAGVVVVAVMAIRNAFDALSGALDAFAGIARGISKIFGGIRGVLKAWQHEMNAKAFRTFAEAILVLAGALAVLTFVDTLKLEQVAVILGAFTAAVSVFAIALSKFASAGKLTLNVVGLSTAIAILASSLLILVKAFADLQKIETADVLTRVAAIAGLAAIMGVAAVQISKHAPKLTTGSFFLISFASAVKLLVQAINDIENVDITSAIATVGLAVTLVGALAVLAAVCKKTKSATDVFGVKTTVKSGADALGLIAMVTSLYLLVGVIKKLGKMNLAEIRSAITAMVPIMAMLATLMIASKFAGQYANEAGKALLAASAAMLIMSYAIKSLAKLDGGELSRASYVIERILVVFAGITLVSNFAGEHASKAGSAILAMTASIALLVVPILALSKIDDAGIQKAIAAIDNIAVFFSILIASTKFATDAKKTIMALGISVGILATVLAVLAVLDPSGLLTATIAIDSLIASFALLAAASKYVGGSKTTLIVMTACVGILGVILAELCKLPTDNALQVALALGVLLDALAVAMLLLSKVGFISPTVISSAAYVGAALDVFVVIVGALVGIAGVLANQEGVLGTFQNGIKLLQSIGQAIGEFVGGLAGGLVSGAMKSISSALPQLGTDLTTFMGNMEGFFSGAKAIDKSVLDGVSTLASVILTLTAANVLDGLAGWLTGGRNLARFGEEMAAFGPHFKTFANDISSVNDTEAVKAAAGAAQVVADFARSIPNTGGALSYLIGDNTLSVFGEELRGFAPGFVYFANQIQSANIDTATIESVMKSAEAVAAFANQIPNSGVSLISMLVGDNTLSEFGAQLRAFAPGFVYFATLIQNAGIDNDTVKAAVATATTLTQLASSIPNSGGTLAKWFGDNNISDFGEDLWDFGYYFVQYSKKMEEVSPDIVDRTTQSAKALVALADSIPNMGSMFEVFTGSNDIATFGKRLKDFGTGLKDYADIMDTITVNHIDVVTVSFMQLVRALKELNEIDASELAFLPDRMRAIGYAMVNIFTSELNFGYFSAEEAGQYLVSGLISGISSKKENLKNTARTLVNAFFSALEEEAEIHSPSKRAERDGEFAVQGFANGVNGNQSILTKAGQGLANAFMGGYRKLMKYHSPPEEVYDDGEMADEAYANGVNDNQEVVKKSGLEMAAGFLRGLGGGLKSSGGFSQTTWLEGAMSVIGLKKGAESEAESLTNIGEQIAASMTESMNDVFSSSMPEVGTSSMKNLATGIKQEKSPEEAAKEKADKIRKIFEDSMSKFDLNTTTANLEYDLWKAVNEKNANEGQLAAAQLANTAQQLQNQAEKLDLARQEYEKISEEFGKGSTQEQESYNRFLQQQISYQNLSVQLSEQQKELTEATANVRAQEIQKQKTAQDTYNAYMKQQAGALLKQGFTMKEIQAYAQKISGYDPAKMLELNRKTLNQTITGNAEAIKQTWSSAAQVTGESMKTEYTQMGLESATAFGTGLQNGSQIPVNETIAIGDNCATVIDEQQQVWNVGGYNMADNLAAGLLANSGTVTEAAKTVAQNAYAQAMAALGIGTTASAAQAQKQAQTAGAAMAGGFAGGFLDEDYAIYDATGDISERMLQEALDYALMIQEAVQDKLEGFEPMITPVINMDDVQGTLDAIDALISHASTASFDLGEADRISQDISSRGYLGVQHGGHDYDEVGGDGGGDVYISYTQNNYSPEALDESEIYRESTNALSDFSDHISQDLGGRASGAWD